MGAYVGFCFAVYSACSATFCGRNVAAATYSESRCAAFSRPIDRPRQADPIWFLLSFSGLIQTHAHARAERLPTPLHMRHDISGSKQAAAGGQQLSLQRTVA